MTAVAQQSRNAGVPWWLVLLEGIALLILGLLLVASPGMTAALVVQFMGFYWLIAGIFKIISIFLDSSGWGWKLFGGILGILAGIIIIQHPIWAPFVVGATLVLILGIEGLIFGAVGLYQAFTGAGWGTGILGAVSILFGLLLLFNVWGYTLALPWAIGILAIIGGIVAIVNSFRMK